MTMSSSPLSKLIAPLAYASGAASRHWRGEAARSARTVVVCYHRVVPDGAGDQLFDVERGLPASAFERQIRFLLRHFEPIAASRVLEAGRPGQLRFAITFDDGYGDNHSIAMPILKRLGVSATFFVVSDFVGTDRRFWWESIAGMLRRTTERRLDLDAVLQDGAAEPPRTCPLSTMAEREAAQAHMMPRMLKLPHPDIADVLARLSAALGVPVLSEGRDFPLMTWDQLRELVREGFEIGGHTATHCNLGRPDVLDLQREIVDSNRAIESRLGAPIETFAFPYGRAHHQSDRARTVLADSPLKAVFTTEKGVASERSTRLRVPRVQLNRSLPFVWAHNISTAFAAGA